MRVFTEHPSLRWTAPVVATVCLVGGTAVVGRLTASADTDLPPRTASQLLTDVQQAKVDGLSGTVVASTDLGLPALPGGAGNGGGELSSLVSGTHTMRVWASGKDKARLSLLGSYGESDVIRNGRTVWLWSSQQQEATRAQLPAKNPEHAAPPSTPQHAAQQILAALGPSTDVSVGRSTTVADRAAYELVLSPKQSGSLIKDVRVAIDGTTHVPLGLQVHSTKISKPAISVGFTSVDFTKPDDGQFTFNPPAGTKVSTQTVPSRQGALPQALPSDLGGLLKATNPNVVGAGWTSVLTATLPPEATSDVKSAAQLLPRVSGPWGSGRQLEGTLFTALITDNGKVLIGAVPPKTLQAAVR